MRVAIALACLFSMLSIQVVRGQTDAEHGRKTSNERLLKQKLAERDKLLEEIKRLRQLTGRPEQVMVHVRILEASPEVMKELGLQGPYGIATKKSSGDDDELIRQDGSLAKSIETARSDKRLKVLAQPSIVVRSGRPATLMSGGEFPVILSKAEGKSGIEWREYGTRLEVVPTTLGKERLRLDIVTEFSALDSTTSVAVARQKVPGLSMRKSNSQVEIQLGQTFVLGGLISTREVNSTREKQQIELVTLVRCERVDGQKIRKSID